MNPALIASLLSAAISGAAGFALAWQLQTGNITKLELDHANERIAIQRAARTQIERQTTAVATAQSNAAGRAVVLRSNVRSAALVGDGLRVKTADAVRNAASDPAACSQSVAAIGIVFNQCVTELTEMGAIADRHASDAQMMQEAWPK